METIVKEGITSHRSELTSDPYIPVVYVTTNKNTYRITFIEVQHNILNEFDLHFILTDWNEKLYRRNRCKDWMWWNNARFGFIHFGKYLEQSSYETLSRLTTSRIFDSYHGASTDDFDDKDYFVVRSAIQYNIETYGFEQFFNSLEWKLIKKKDKTTKQQKEENKMVDMIDPNEMNTSEYSEYIVQRIMGLMDAVSNAKGPGGTILDEWREEIQSLKIEHKKLFGKEWFEV